MKNAPEYTFVVKSEKDIIEARKYVADETNGLVPIDEHFIFRVADESEMRGVIPKIKSNADRSVYCGSFIPLLLESLVP